jgi:hypothetical protein
MTEDFESVYSAYSVTRRFFPNWSGLVNIFGWFVGTSFQFRMIYGKCGPGVLLYFIWSRFWWVYLSLFVVVTRLYYVDFRATVVVYYDVKTSVVGLVAFFILF